jgi:DNA-binding winged helix-turn-helix (wHTH) protein/Flp pilus assembly protein TadD
MSPVSPTYAFGPFVADASRRVLLRDGQPVRVTAKVFDLLLLLLENRDRLVDKNEISRHLWPDTHVSETNLAVNVSALRKALGDTRDTGAYIVTVTGRGYRFAAPVSPGGGGTEATTPPGELSGHDGGLRTLAVLPFRSLSTGRRDEVLELGLTDALITRLSRLSSLTVRPTSSVVRFAGREVSLGEAGAALKVGTILTGGLQRTKGQVRVTAQLVRVSDGRTLWAHTFDEKAGDVFRVEDSVSRRVANALRLQLSGPERRALAVQHTSNSKAYELYLRSRFFWNQRTDEALLKGIEYGEAAAAEDPGFALAHAAVADCYVALAFYGGVQPRTAYTRVIVSAGKALALDGSLAEAHTSLACASLASWDWKTAGACFDRALELNPQYANAHNWRTVYLLSLRRFDEAVAEAKRARELEPLSLVLNANVGWVLLHARRFEEALHHSARVAEMDRHFGPARWVAGLALAQLGRLADAAKELQQAVALSGGSPYALSAQAYVHALAGHKPQAARILKDLNRLSAERYVSPHSIAHVHIALGDHDAAMQWLERSFEDRDDYLVLLNADPFLDPLRDDPRIHDLARRVGIPRP